MLFSESMDCIGSPLWVVALFGLIFHWISIILIIIEIINKYKSIE
jgi:hypothetical protein